MLIPTQEAHGDYYFLRTAWLLPHIVLGIVAILIGPFQFVPAFRSKNLKLHRNMGKVYIISVVVSGILGMYLAVTSDVNASYAVGLFSLGFAWAATAIMAFLSIKKRKIELHKEWMVRSYVITFAFVTFRFFSDIIKASGVMTFVERLDLMSWASWVVPLFIAELIMQGRKIYR